MADLNEKKIRSHNYEFLVAVILGILAIGSFALQAITLSDKTTKLETVLFNTLQFLLTVGFGWFSTRAVSRSEFEASLKRFAVSAYRRISDIENIVQRLQIKIANMRADRTGEDSNDLDIVEAIVEDTVQVVSSSIADWADVIGEELIAIETIKRLKTEKAEIKTAPPTNENTADLDQKVKQIDEKINSLISSLPARLQYDTRREENILLDEREAIKWMIDKHKEQDGLKSKLVSGGRYYSERNPSTVEPGEVLFGIRKPIGQGIQVEDATGVVVGRLINGSPFKYDVFARALRACYGTDRTPLEFMKIDHIREDGITYSIVRVRAEPIIQEEE